MDHQPFLKAIIDHPADDGPRLVYADWLDEQGESDRAEFVRVQCELARLAGLPQPLKIHAGPHRGLGVGRIGFECEKKLSQEFSTNELVGQIVAVHNTISHPGGAVLFLEVDWASDCTAGGSPISGSTNWSHYERYWVEGKLVKAPEHWAYEHTNKGINLGRREWKLWRVHGVNWLFEQPGCTQKDVRDGHHASGAMSGSVYGSGHLSHFSRIDQDFRRGFLDSVSCTTTDWIGCGRQLVRLSPITKVNFLDCRPQKLIESVWSLWSQAWLDTYPNYGIDQAVVPDAIFALLQSPPYRSYIGSVVHESLEEIKSDLSNAALLWAKLQHAEIAS